MSCSVRAAVFLVLAALQSEAGAAAPPFRLTLLNDTYAKASGAQCLDHTPAGYYIREQDPKRWIIFLQGGGLCVEPIDCIGRAKSALGSSKYFPHDQPPEGDSTTSPSHLNPFAAWSHVWVPYCSGDTWLGSSTKGHPLLLGLQMSGHRIIEGIVDELLNSTSFSSASDVVLSGSSAGGIGTFHHADWLAEKLGAAASLRGATGPRVVGLPVEGMFFPEQWPVLVEAFALGSRTPLANFMSQYLAVLDFQEPWFPPVCVEASQKEGFAKGDCFDVSRMLFYTKTPLFIAMNRFDSLLIQDLGVCLTCKVTDAPGSLNGRYIRFYGSRMNETIVNVSRALPQVSWFVPSEFHHDENFYQFFDSVEKTIGGTSLRAAIEAWYHEQKQVVLVEPLCNEDGPCTPARDQGAVGGADTDVKGQTAAAVTQEAGAVLDSAVLHV